MSDAGVFFLDEQAALPNAFEMHLSSSSVQVLAVNTEIPWLGDALPDFDRFGYYDGGKNMNPRGGVVMLTRKEKVHNPKPLHAGYLREHANAHTTPEREIRDGAINKGVIVVQSDIDAAFASENDPRNDDKELDHTMRMTFCDFHFALWPPPPFGRFNQVGNVLDLLQMMNDQYPSQARFMAGDTNAFIHFEREALYGKQFQEAGVTDHFLRWITANVLSSEIPQVKKWSQRLLRKAINTLPRSHDTIYSQVDEGAKIIPLERKTVRIPGTDHQAVIMTFQAAT